MPNLHKTAGIDKLLILVHLQRMTKALRCKSNRMEKAGHRTVPYLRYLLLIPSAKVMFRLFMAALRLGCCGNIKTLLLCSNEPGSIKISDSMGNTAYVLAVIFPVIFTGA
jgi:hypothetical protein